MTDLAPLFETLRASATTSPVCRDCRIRLLELKNANVEWTTVARRAAQSEERHAYYADQVADRRKDLDYAIRIAEEHLADPHAEKVPEATPAAPTAEPVSDGKVACPKCGSRRTPRGNRIGRHQSRNGIPCSGGWVERPVITVPLPEVRSQGALGVGTNTLPVTGRCHTCDKPISGERRFCGQHAAQRLRGIEVEA